MARLAKDVLAEIPDQLLSFMKSRGIEPRPPVPATSESPSMSTTTTTTTATQKERKMLAWNESSWPSSRAVGHFRCGRCVFVNLCVYVCCMVYGLAVSTVIWKGHLPEQNALLWKCWLGFPSEIWTGSAEFATIHKIKCSSALFLQSSVLTFQISYKCSGLVSSTTSPAEARRTPLQVSVT